MSPSAESPPAGLEGFAHVAGFVQRTPSDGEPATQATDVFLGYDERAFYAVFVAADEAPHRVRARLAPRENVGGDDAVTLMLDTDGDRRRAYSFRANPRGVQWDALWTEGQGFDTSFDAVWTSRAWLTPGGYVVLFEIPFESLRFPTPGERTWGIVLSRSIPRDEGETSFWPRVSSEVEGTLTQSAALEGISGVSPGRNIRAIPYTNARAFRALDTRAEGGPAFRNGDEVDFGADVKAVLDDRFVLDVTANPDFSQVESDQPQVTVNQRFERFFPERRPFFTENADYFRTPIDVLFTRRIADPRVGGRFTGKVAGWSFGALLIDDESPGKLAEPGTGRQGDRAWFAVGRLDRDIGEFSRAGAIFAARELGGGFNQVGGVDGRVRLGDHWSVTGQLLGSGTRPIVAADSGSRSEAEGGYAGTISLSRTGRQFSYSGELTDISPGFEARAGFVPRTDIRRMEHFASYFFRPERTLISWGPELSFQRVWDHDGTLLDEEAEVSLEWHFVGGTSFEVNYGRAAERLRPEDHPSLERTRSYDVGFVDIEYETRFVDWFEVEGNVRFGGQVNFEPVDGREPAEADWFELETELGLRPLTALRIDNTVLWTTLKDPNGDRIFTDRILRTRWNWQFTRAFSVRAILQYEHTAVDPALTALERREALNADLLITCRLDPWTAVYAGVNTNGENLEIVDVPGEGRLLRRVDGLRSDARQVFVKLSYLLQF